MDTAQRAPVWPSVDSESQIDELLEITNTTIQGTNSMEVYGVRLARQEATRREFKFVSHQLPAWQQDNAPRGETSGLRRQLMTERRERREQVQALQDRIDRLEKLVENLMLPASALLRIQISSKEEIAQSGHVEVLPMAGLGDLCAISPEGRQQLGFPYDVSEELTEEDGRIIEEAAPPAWLVAHTQSRKQRR